MTESTDWRDRHLSDIPKWVWLGLVGLILGLSVFAASCGGGDTGQPNPRSTTETNDYEVRSYCDGPFRVYVRYSAIAVVADGRCRG